ncbi:basic helix-loop-helix domain-containing protein USF3 isoform X4 [Osmerus eperlanus]|uniref:basic helix-loop-helix domain-containing protein USF3 isoform X4 n=1 Tax=Osmerus eperlanus TaxID=29151 RepID=UPI002E154235
MPEMTETQDLGHKPRRRKNKEIHNAVEKKRKEKINAGINRIGNLLPCSQALKQSKNMILDEAFRFITELKRQNDAMLLEGGDKGQAEEIRRLRRQLEELRKESGHYIELLKAHDINFLDDPSIHWKGKMRCAKVAKVTPNHQPSKGIIVYPNGNTMCAVGKEPGAGKQQEEAVFIQPSCDVILHHPHSYITVQGLCPLPTGTTALPQPTAPAPSLTAASSPATHLPYHFVPSLTALPQVVTTSRALVSEISTQLNTQLGAGTRSQSYTTPSSSGLLRAEAAGSTQTTWTTLQLAGNTVQPVCQNLPAPEISTTGQTMQQLTVCPVATKATVQPVHIQMRPQLPIKQAPITAHIQAQPSIQKPPHLQPSIITQPHLLPQCAVLPQTARVPKQPVLAHPALMPQPQTTVLQKASVVPHPQTAVLPQPALGPQPQAAVLPLLQTMQVLQVNPAGTTVAGVTASQNTNNPSVVILQQANPCSTQPVVREDLTNQTACQHIVIIQAPNQTSPVPQNPSVGMVTATVPVVSSQIISTSCTTSTTGLHTVGGKQLVHILPRPTATTTHTPQPAACPPASPASSAPQTITVNGQVFALKPMKTSDKGGSQGAQSTLQLVQPTSSEEPTTNVALNSLGALSSLNQSISQGMPQHSISSQGSLQLSGASPAYSVVQHHQLPPVSGSAPAPATPVRQLQSPSGTTAGRGGGMGKAAPKRIPTKRTKTTRRREPKQRRSTGTISARPVVAAEESPKQTGAVSQDAPPSATEAAGAVSGVANAPTVSDALKRSINSESFVCSAQSTLKNINVCTSQTGLTTSVQPALTVSGVNSTQGEVVVCIVGTSPTVGPAVSSQSKAHTHTQNKPAASQDRQAVSVTTGTAQIGSPPSAVTSSKQSKPGVTSAWATETRLATVSPATTACQPLVGTATSTQAEQLVSLQDSVLTTSVCQTRPANIQEHQFTPLVQAQPLAQTLPLAQTQPLAPSSVPSSTASSSAALLPVVPPMPAEFRKRTQTNRPSAQQPDQNNLASSSSSTAVLKLPDISEREREPQRGESNPRTAMEKESQRNNTTPSRKISALPQQVYSLDHQVTEQPNQTHQTSNTQTDSPMSAGAGGGRGFSVASMLPQAFTFTSEQADILALAMLEQDSSGGRVDIPISANTPTWEPPKSQQAPHSKERVTGPQTKVTKTTMEPVVAKPPSQVPVRGQAGESGVSGPSGARHPQNISYAQSHTHTQPHVQSQAHAGNVGTLSVNNLIRSSSSQQPYPGSPNMAVGQQGSVPSPVGTSALASQPSTPGHTSCSGNGQLSDYAPVKSSLMRASMGMGERQVKDISKRPAPEDVMLPSSNKRPKTCPSAAPSVGLMEVKTQDHGQSQMMIGQVPPSSSTVMSRLNPDGGGTLFSNNSFMSTVLRPTDSHCAPQHQEQSQPGVLHLPQGHSQHGATQPGQHLGPNQYLKQQQQQQQQQQDHQRHHLYQLQHHLTQPDPAQLHSLHQRALQQDQQHVQNAQKKRGLVRANQSGPPVGLQQKQHHLEKAGVHQQQQQQQQTQQHQQQHAQQPSQHQQQQQQQTHQQSQHQQQQPSQHQQAQHQQHQQQAQHQQQSQTQQHQQQSQQQQQQLQQHQSSHSRQQHLQQHLQQQQHFGASRHQEKSCEAQPAGPRAHHSSHLTQQEHHKSGQDHMQRLMSSRTLEQQLISQPGSNPASRPSDLACAPSRQERHRVSSYSAEALIGKTSSSGDQQQRMVGLHLQATRGSTQEQPDLRGYLDTSRGKGNIGHNPQNPRLSQEHPGPSDIQRVLECPPFKALGGRHQLGGFEVQVSRGGDMAPKSIPPSQRGPQGQQQGVFRMGVGSPGDGRPRGGYSGAHPGPQGVQIGAGLPRDQEGCHHSFMQSLLSPHISEQTNHQRAVQCCPPVSMEYSCVPGASAGDMQAKASSPSVPPTQKTPGMRLGEGNKGHLAQAGGNMHGGPGVRAGLPHPATPHSSSEPGRSSAPSRPPGAVSQRSRHLAPEAQPAKLRPGDRLRSGTLRPGNPFEPEGHLPLPTGGGVLLGRPQSGGEARRSSIVRFMADSSQVSGDNNLVPDQHLAQNFGFPPFIAEGGMNHPPPINANSTFIPPVSQSSSSRTPALLPVEPQNTIPSFYPSYSPAAHPSLPSDIPLQYFSNQMFTSPGADKASAAPLNNRFGSILSPPRPVGFAQASFPLLPDMPPMPITNSSGITAHLSNFSLTSLFPEIAAAMPSDGSSMPMSPLLSLSNTSSSDSGKQPNRPAHNISHILGHDGSSAV